jgi:hypothetical protein
VLAARSLGYLNLSDQECIDLMDEFKEWGDVSAALYGDYGEATWVTGREYLQNIGNEARKIFGDSFWIDQVLPAPSRHPDPEIRKVENYQAINRMYPDAEYVLIPDLRYPNEAERIQALHGGTVWEVIRPGVESDGHDSEQPLPRNLVDLTINNSGTLDDLRHNVLMAISAL